MSSCSNNNNTNSCNNTLLWQHEQQHYSSPSSSPMIEYSTSSSASDMLHHIHYETSEEDLSYFFNHEEENIKQQQQTHLNYHQQMPSAHQQHVPLHLEQQPQFFNYWGEHHHDQDFNYLNNEEPVQTQYFPYQEQQQQYQVQQQQQQQQLQDGMGIYSFCRLDEQQTQQNCIQEMETFLNPQGAASLPIEHAFEQLLEQSQKPSCVQPTFNYYQIFHGKVSKPETSCFQTTPEMVPQTPPTPSIMPNFQLNDISSISKKINNVDENNATSQAKSNAKSTKNISCSPLEDCRKKNVVKNIMNALKKFIMSPIEHGYSQQTIEEVLHVYNKHAKNHNNQAVANVSESLENMQMKFKRYLAHKKFNHYSLGLLMHHPVYVHILRYFLEGPVEHWASNSRVTDLNSHRIIIEFLKKCFDDLSLLDYLEKKKQHHNNPNSNNYAKVTISEGSIVDFNLLA